MSTTRMFKKTDCNCIDYNFNAVLLLDHRCVCTLVTKALREVFTKAYKTVKGVWQLFGLEGKVHSWNKWLLWQDMANLHQR